MLYTSFEDEEAVQCLICGQISDDRILFGENLTADGITAHYFCLVIMYFQFFQGHSIYLKYRCTEKFCFSVVQCTASSNR